MTQAVAAASQSLKATAERVLKELARIAFLDPRKLMTWGPGGVTFTKSEDLDEDTAACVCEASQTVTESGGTIRVKTCSKLDALKLLGQHLHLWSEEQQDAAARQLTLNVNVTYEEMRQLPPDELVRRHRRTLGLPPPPAAGRPDGAG